MFQCCSVPPPNLAAMPRPPPPPPAEPRARLSSRSTSSSSSIDEPPPPPARRSTPQFGDFSSSHSAVFAEAPSLATRLFPPAPPSPPRTAAAALATADTDLDAGRASAADRLRQHRLSRGKRTAPPAIRRVSPDPETSADRSPPPAAGGAPPRSDAEPDAEPPSPAPMTFAEATAPRGFAPRPARRASPAVDVDIQETSDDDDGAPASRSNSAEEDDLTVFDLASRKRYEAAVRSHHKLAATKARFASERGRRDSDRSELTVDSSCPDADDDGGPACYNFLNQGGDDTVGCVMSAPSLNAALFGDADDDDGGGGARTDGGDQCAIS